MHSEMFSRWKQNPRHISSCPVHKVVVQRLLLPVQSPLITSVLLSLIQPAVSVSSADIFEMMLQLQVMMMMNLLEASAAEDSNEVGICNLTTPGRVRLFAVK